MSFLWVLSRMTGGQLLLNTFLAHEQGNRHERLIQCPTFPSHCCDKSNLGRKGFISADSLESIMKGSQSMNSTREPGYRTGKDTMEGSCLLVCCSSTWCLSNPGPLNSPWVASVSRVSWVLPQQASIKKMSR